MRWTFRQKQANITHATSICPCWAVERGRCTRQIIPLATHMITSDRSIRPWSLPTNQPTAFDVIYQLTQTNEIVSKPTNAYVLIGVDEHASIEVMRTLHACQKWKAAASFTWLRNCRLLHVRSSVRQTTKNSWERTADCTCSKSVAHVLRNPCT